MRLSHLTDKILLIDTKNLAGAEREATTKILHHIKEIDRRKLYSDLRYSSLYEYCIRELGYSDSSAHRRIVAARMLAVIPEIEKKLKKGTLTLTNISQVKEFFKEPEEQKVALAAVEGLTKKECEKKLFEMSGKEIPPRETKQRLSENKIQIAIVLDDDANEAMEEVRRLLGAEMSSSELIKFMAQSAKKEIERTKFKQTDKPRSSHSPAKEGRVISASVKREVYLRDKNCMQCGSKHNLNYDHRKAFALGGPGDVDNIRLLCFNCNQRARIRVGLKGPQHKCGP